MTSFEVDALKALNRIATALEKIAAAMPKPTAPPMSVDLDTERGNFRVSRDPKKWTGASCVGLLLSECPPEFLEVLASGLEWKADQEAKEPAAGEKDRRKYEKYSRLDAARARGWAERIRKGYKPPPSAKPQETSRLEAPKPLVAPPLDDVPFRTDDLEDPV